MATEHDMSRLDSPQSAHRDAHYQAHHGVPQEAPRGTHRGAYRDAPHEAHRDAWSFHMATFGCKVNQYETQAIREAWLARGAVESEEAIGARVVLINSCAVTERAVADVRQYINRLHRDSPETQILVTGCAAQVMADAIAALSGVTHVISQEGKDTLPLYHPDAKEVASLLIAPQGASQAGDTAPNYSSLFITDFKRARPVVKVQDGCSHRCTYCIVPLARGASRSRDAADVIAELRRLLAAGFREIMLSGINLRQYGRDCSPLLDFWDLLLRIEQELAPEWKGKARLRLSSLEPGQITERALEVLGSSQLLCPHLHISLQSGSSTVLRRMGRGHYKPEPLLERLHELQRFWPRIALGADILMGFPQESEEEYAETVAFIRAMPLTYAHVFPYSRRPGTVAASMTGQLPKDIKKARAATIRSIIAEKKEAFMQQVLQCPELSVVLDGDTSQKGVSEYYLDCIVQNVPEHHDARHLLRVRPLGVCGGTSEQIMVEAF